MKEDAVDRTRIGSWIALVMGLAFVAVVGWRTIGTSVLWHHLAVGRFITEHGIPRTDPLSFVAGERAWTNVNWLYDVVVNALWQGAGPGGVAALHVAAVLGALVFSLLSLRRWAGPASAASVLLLCGWMLAPVFTPRPDVLAVLFPAYFLFFLSAPRRPATLWSALLPAQVLWANIDSSFLLGPILALVAAAESRAGAEKADVAASGGPRGRSGGAYLLAGGLLLATLLNPRGPMILGHTLAPAFRASSRLFEVWISPFSAFFAPSWGRHAVTLALVLGALGLVAHRSRLPLLMTVMAILSAFLVIRSITYLPLFAIMSFPFLCLSVKAIGSAAARAAGSASAAATRYGPAVASAAAFLLLVLSTRAIVSSGYYRTVGAACRFGSGVTPASMPDGMVEMMRRYPVLDRVFQLPVDGGYLAWGEPGRKIFVDLRGDVYGAEFARMLRRMAAGEDNIRDLVFARWNIDAVALNGSVAGADVLLRSLLDSGTWALVYLDGNSAVAVQRKSKYQDLIADADLQAGGLRLLNEETWRAEDALARGRRPELSARLVGGAFLLSAMDRSASASRLFRLLLAAAPQMEGARFHLAICQAKMGQLEAAEQNLLTLTRNRRYSTEAWRWLSQVYRKQGRQQDAEAAARHAGARTRPTAP